MFLLFQQEALGSSRVATGPQRTSHVAPGKSGLHSICKGHLGIPLESLQSNKASS